MTTTTIRVSEPRELLAYLPYRLGFQPRQSAVVVSLRGARGRLGLVARVDLADLADPVSGPDVAAGLANHVWRDGAAQAVVVLYDDVVRSGGAWQPEVASAAQHALEALEPMVGSTQVWLVDDSRYYALDCEDDTCCPAEGRPLDELRSSQVSAEMVFAGASVAEHRQAATEVAPAAKAARYNVRRVARRWAERRSDASGRGATDPAALHAWQRDSLHAWEAALAAAADGEEIGTRDLGRIDAALHDTFVRDAVIAGLVLGAEGAAALPDLAEEDARRCIGDAFGALFDPQDGPVPERDLLGPVERVLRAVIAHAPDRSHAPAATVLAAIAWWTGDGAVTNDWLGRALGMSPGYRLAELLVATVEAGLPPGWARRAAAQDAGLR